MAADGRKAKRQPVEHDATIYTASGETIAKCTLRNVSETGAQIELARETHLPKNFVLSLSFKGAVYRRCEMV